jgi:FMN phosphatase YigB (HAD superfamily)
MKNEKTVEILKTLRTKGKKVFILTNSTFYWTDIVLSYSLGKSWQDLFDLILVEARKPLFQ